MARAAVIITGAAACFFRAKSPVTRAAVMQKRHLASIKRPYLMGKSHLDTPKKQFFIKIAENLLYSPRPPGMSRLCTTSRGHGAIVPPRTLHYYRTKHMDARWLLYLPPRCAAFRLHDVSHALRHRLREAKTGGSKSRQMGGWLALFSFCVGCGQLILAGLACTVFNAQSTWGQGAARVQSWADALFAKGAVASKTDWYGH